MNPWLRWLIVPVIFAACGIGGDYAGWYGMHDTTEKALLHVTYLAFDSRTHQAIKGMHVTCFRRKSDNVCTQRERADGAVVLNFVMFKQVRSTWLFRKAEAWLADDDGLIRLAFIHPDYDRLFLALKLPDLLDRSGRDNVVELTRSP